MFEVPTKINDDIKALLPDLKLPGESALRGALGFADHLQSGKFADLKKRQLKNL